MTTLFYRIPRLTILVIALILAGGIGALLMLGRQEDPTLVERYGYVLVTLPGADAERIEALITEPIEAALMELPEVAELESISRAGVSQVSISVRDDISKSEVDEAWTLIRQQVDKARAVLPAGASVPEVSRQYLGASTLLIGLVWTGEGPPPLSIMARMARNLEDEIRALPGTEETALYGIPEEEIRVAFDDSALATLGLSPVQAAAIIGASDAKAPAGRLRSDGAYLGLEVGGAFDGVARIRSVPLAQSPDGRTVRVSDVAEVSKTQQDPANSMALATGKRMVAVAGFVEEGLRVDQWASRARGAVATFSETAPAGISVEILFDQSNYTEDRLNGLAQNLGYSALIVFVVLYLVMGLRAAFAVGSALPLTVCLVLILFNIFDFPLHQMSVTGLVIALGLLIDNAVVMVDEYEKRRDKGDKIEEALRHAISYLAGPLFASTLTTALAFAPIAMLPGSAGEFVGMIGVSVIFAVSTSLLVALTLVPALAAWMDRKGRDRTRPHRWWVDGIKPGPLTEGYRWSVHASLRHPIIGIALGLSVPFVGFMLAASLPPQFFPPTDRDQFQIEVTLPPEASMADTIALTQAATEKLMAYEGITGVNWILGESAPRVYYNAFNTQNGVAGYAAGFVQTTGNATTRAILPQIQIDMRGAFPQAQFLTLPYEQGPPIPAPIEILVYGPDLRTLDSLGDQVRTALAETPGVTYTMSVMQLGAPKAMLDADEASTLFSGLRLVELAGELRADLEGVPAGSVLEGVEELPVRVVAPASRRGDLSELRTRPLPAIGGGIGTPIGALGEISLVPEVAVISRGDGQRVAIVYAYLDPYVLPAPTLARALERLEASGFEVPNGYRFSLGGEAAESGDAVGQLFGTALPLIIAMAGCVALVFNSFRMAALVMVTGFLSIGIAFFGVWLFGMPRGFVAIIGAMGLLGIAINGAIIVLSALKANAEAAAGDRHAQGEVVFEASRHIIATTLTTMGGFMPLIIAGDAFWLPMAAGIAGGVFGSAILALYFVPAVFALMRPRPRRAEGEILAPV
jgi:multidrug efflux pump subunit AcrB